MITYDMIRKDEAIRTYITRADESLIALGYTKGEAVNAMAAVKGTDLTVEEYIKQALKRLF